MLCLLAETQDGAIVNAKTRQPFTYADPCMEYGPTFIYNEWAAFEVRKAISEFINTRIKAK